MPLRIDASRLPAFFLVSSFLLGSLWAPARAEPTLESLGRRIEELEKQQELHLSEASEPKSQVHAFLNDNLTLGGFYETGFLVIDGDDTKLQAANNSNTLGLNIAAEFSSNIRFVSQIWVGFSHPLQNEHNDPTATTERGFERFNFGALLTQGYLEYSLGRAFVVQAGTGYVPFGYALQQRELVQFVRQAGPQLLRTNNLVSPLWSGIHVHGSFDQGKNDWGYNFYTFTPVFYPKQPGVGGRLWWSSADEEVTLGLSSQLGKTELGSYEAVGTDLRLDFHPFSIKAEYIRHLEDDEDPWSAYLEPSVFIYQEELLLYVFGDYANSSMNRAASAVTLTELDPYRQLEYGAGLNWLPTSFTRFRFGFTYHDYLGKTAVQEGLDRDYFSFDLSAGVAF